MKLTKLFIYPIKSCASYEINSEWPLCETGLKYDREWMIVNQSGIFLNQLKQPKLCLLKPAIDLTNRTLHLTYADYDDTGITIPLDTDENTPMKEFTLCESKICGDRVQVLDCGDEVADWLTQYIGKAGLRLVRNHSTDRKNEMEKKLSFSNAAQILLINEGSILWLIQQLKDFTFLDLSMESMMSRFRPNLVVSGDVPLIEQTWNEVTVGQINFKVEGPCSRCQMICVDQATAEKSKEVLTTLSSALKGKIVFGIYLHILSDINEQLTNLIRVDEIVMPMIKDS